MTVALLRPSSADAIDKCFAQLAVAFGRHIDHVQMRVYRTALSDLPIEVIEAAALQLQRTGGTFLPTTAQWHEVAERILAERILAERTRETLAQPRGTAADHECAECRDTGWGEVDRDGKIVCIPCSCRPTNSSYKRMTAASRKTQNEEVKR